MISKCDYCGGRRWKRVDYARLEELAVGDMETLVWLGMMREAALSTGSQLECWECPCGGLGMALEDASPLGLADLFGSLVSHRGQTPLGGCAAAGGSA